MRPRTEEQSCGLSLFTKEQLFLYYKRKNEQKAQVQKKMNKKLVRLNKINLRLFHTYPPLSRKTALLWVS